VPDVEELPLNIFGAVVILFADLAHMFPIGCLPFDTTRELANCARLDLCFARERLLNLQALMPLIGVLRLSMREQHHSLRVLLFGTTVVHFVCRELLFHFTHGVPHLLYLILDRGILQKMIFRLCV